MGVFRKSRKNLAVRGPAARPVLRRMGEIQRNHARSAEIQRNRHLLGIKGVDFAPRESAADCVEISPWNHDESRRFAHPPPGRFFDGSARFWVSAHPFPRTAFSIGAACPAAAR